MEEGGQSLVVAFGWIGVPGMEMAFVQAYASQHEPCVVGRGVLRVLAGPDLSDGNSLACAEMSLFGSSNAWGILCGRVYWSDTLDIVSR